MGGSRYGIQSVRTRRIQGFGDGATYRFKEGGVLIIDAGDRMLTYSPGGWHSIDEDARPPASPRMASGAAGDDLGGF